MALRRRAILSLGMTIRHGIFGIKLWTLAGACTAALVWEAPVSRAESWSLVSPGGQVKVSVRLTGAAGGAGGALSFRIEQGPEGGRALVLGDSPLGLKLQREDFTEGLQFDSAQAEKTVEEHYAMPHGKRRLCRNQAKQIVLSFRNRDGQPLELELRAYDDGVAFRYRLPGPAGKAQTLESEATGFALPRDAKLWCAPSDKATLYSPAYETYYENEMPAGMASPLGVGWSFPLLFRTADSRHWALITEANLDSSFCASRLCNTPSNGVYRVALPNSGEGNGQGSIQPSSALPWELPWRVVIVGSSPATMVESTLVADVSAPSRLEGKDTSWIRPGRVAWSWWSDNPSPKDASKQCRFVDLAAEMGWEYVLVDANWDIMESGNIHDVLRYAKDKGVGVLLWYNSGGPHNRVTEKPRDCLTYPSVRKFELNLLRQWGVKGIKVDFFQSDKQDVIRLYRSILQDAAEQQIMINFHAARCRAAGSGLIRT